MKDLKVLVIDPDFDYLQLISQFLSTEGFHVVTATDGEEGLRKAMIESPDLILMEPMLSKLHGFTLCNIVSKEFKKKIPVVILTNHYQDAHHKKEAIQVYGAAAYLMRPIMKKELRSTIFDVVGNRSMEGVGKKPVPYEQKAKESTKEMPGENLSSKIVSEREAIEGGKVTEELAKEDRAPTVVNGVPEAFTENQLENGTESPQELVMEEKVESSVTSVEMPAKSSGNSGNGSNGKSKVDKMIDDIESEFGLITEKKATSKNHIFQI